MKYVPCQITKSNSASARGLNLEHVTQDALLRLLPHFPVANELNAYPFAQDILTLQHYGDVIIGTISSQTTILTIVTQPFIRAQIKENIRVTGLCGEFTGDRWIPRTNGQ